MFYEPKTAKSHGLPHDPFKAIVAPRPIGWISTISKSGAENLAPYSFFQSVGTNPYFMMFASEGWKDSATNARDSGEFTCSYVSFDLREQMNASSIDAPQDVSEAEFCGIEMANSESVAPRRVAKAYSALECKVTEILQPKTIEGTVSDKVIVIGQVTGIYIDEKVLKDGIFDVTLARPITRLGYMDFEGPEGLFAMQRPVWEK